LLWNTNETLITANRSVGFGDSQREEEREETRSSAGMIDLIFAESDAEDAVHS